MTNSKQKLVIVLRKDLGMSPGKLIAQAIHAASRTGKIMQYDEGNEPFCIVCYVKKEKDLITLGEKAAIAGIPFGLQIDAGHTEVEKGTLTVLAIGPDDEEKVNAITKGLQLFKG